MTTDSQNGAASTETFRSLPALHLPLDLAALPALHLSLDLAAEILCRLSVEQLLQLRCVCRPWNSLISLDSKFARKHLSFSTSNKDRHHLLLSSREFLPYHSPISSLFSSSSILPVIQHRFPLSGVLERRGHDVDVSSCDGMICFAMNDSLAVLCNPFIRKFKISPPLEIPRMRSQSSYTLVYDRISSSYKIIHIGFASSIVQVNIHTLGTDYWRRIQDFPCGYVYRKPGIFVSHTINWLARDNRLVHVIVSLDLEKESYQKLSLPPLSLDKERSDIFQSLEVLGILRGCLSLLSRYSNVWIMKEYGIEKSWTKLFKLRHKEEIGFLRKLLYISEDDRVLMECSQMEKNSMVVYDSVTNIFNIPKMQDNIDFHHVAQDVYVESLISPF